MLGKDHAWSGLAAGTAAGLYLLHASPAGTAELAALTACWATWPDLDQVGSCAARSLGFVSGAVAHVIRRVSGGHRHGTHTLLGAAVFTGLAYAAVVFRHDPAGRYGLAFMLGVALAAGLGALRLGGHYADLIAVAAAGVMAWKGYGLARVPLSCALGQVVHLLGDGCTDEGVPLAWPLWRGHIHLLPEPFAFTTSTRPERWIVAPGLVLVTAWLGWHAAALAVR